MSSCINGEYKTGEYAQLMVWWKQGQVVRWEHRGPMIWVFRGDK